MEPGLLLDSFQGRWASSSLLTRGFDAPALGCLVPAPKSSERSQGLETVNSGSDALRGLWILGLVSVPGPVFRDHPERQRQPSPALTQLPGRSPLPSTGQKEGLLRARVCHQGARAAAPGHFQIPAAQRGFPGGREDSVAGETLQRTPSDRVYSSTRSVLPPGGHRFYYARPTNKMSFSSVARLSSVV
nr:uncharacterized protein LOC102139826 [Macaca fascicularis]